MTVLISIPSEIEAELRERAAAAGEPVDIYASKVLRDAILPPEVEPSPDADEILDYQPVPPLKSIHAEIVCEQRGPIPPISFDPVDVE